MDAISTTQDSTCLANIKQHILHIDDDPAITRLLSRQLETYGITVDCLNDERRWEEQIVAGNHRVVLLDIDLPYQDGLDILRDIKRFDGAIQVIMLTGLVRMHIILDALRNGAEYCFFKPLDDVETLANAVHNTYRRVDHWRQTIRFASSALGNKSPEPMRAIATAQHVAM